MTRRDSMIIPPTLAPYSRYTVLGGVRVHYYDAGAGGAVPLVLVHGLGDEADTWRHVLLPLARRRRVVALDLPGFGRSDKPRRAYTLAFFAQTIAALCGALGIRRAALAGSSLGAAVAQRLALARPALVDRLVLVGGALPIQPQLPAGQLWWFLFPLVGEAVYTSLRRSQEQAYATLRPYYADLDALPPEDQAFLRARVWARVWSNGQRRAFLSALRWLAVDQAARAATYRERLRRLPTPTCLVWGQYDAMVPRAVGEAMAALLPSARLHLVAGSGHLPQQERPEDFVALFSAHGPQET